MITVDYQICDILFLAMYLRIAKIYLQIFGIYPIAKQNLPPAAREYQKFINFLIIAFTSVNLLIYLSTLAYFLIFETKTQSIFFQSIFFTTMTLMRVTVFFLILSKKAQLSLLMDDFDQMIEMREYGKPN